MSVTECWRCHNCGCTDDISLYNQELKKPNFLIAPILPTCNGCGAKVRLTTEGTRQCQNRVFVLTGPIGSGKTSTAEFLYSRHGFNAIDHDCLIDLASHRHDRKVEFNDPEVLAEVEGNLDILTTFDTDIVLSLIILPDELGTYRRMLQMRKLNYTIFFLCPDYDTLLQRTKTRTCFRSVTEEKWVRHFYDQTAPFRNIEADDLVLLDNTDMTVDQSVDTLFSRLH